MGLCVGRYGSDRYFGHNLDLYLILAHWPIYVLAHPFSETEDRYRFAFPNSQRIQYVARSKELGAYLSMMGSTVVLGLVVSCIVALSFFPVIGELFLVLFFAHVPVVHVDRFGRLWIEIFCYKSVGCSVVRLDRRGWLWMPHFT